MDETRKEDRECKADPDFVNKGQLWVAKVCTVFIMIICFCLHIFDVAVFDLWPMQRVPCLLMPGSACARCK